MESEIDKTLGQGADALIKQFTEQLSLGPPTSTAPASSLPAVELPRNPIAEAHRLATDPGAAPSLSLLPPASEDTAPAGAYRPEAALSDPALADALGPKGVDCSYAALSRIENPDDLALQYGGRIATLDPPKLCAILRTLLRVVRLKPPKDRSQFHAFFRSLLPGILQWMGSQAQDLINTLRGANVLKYVYVVEFQALVEDRLAAKTLLSAWDVSELLESYAGLGVKPGDRMLELLLHSMDVNHESFEPKARRVSLQSLEKLELFAILPTAHEALTREPWKRDTRKGALRQAPRQGSAPGSSSSFNAGSGPGYATPTGRPSAGPLLDPSSFNLLGGLDPRLAAWPLPMGYPRLPHSAGYPLQPLAPPFPDLPMHGLGSAFYMPQPHGTGAGGFPPQQQQSHHAFFGVPMPAPLPASLGLGGHVGHPYFDLDAAQAAMMGAGGMDALYAAAAAAAAANPYGATNSAGHHGLGLRPTFDPSFLG